MPIGRPRTRPLKDQVLWLRVAPGMLSKLDAYTKQLEAERPGARVTRQDAARAVLATWGATFRPRRGAR